MPSPHVVVIVLNWNGWADTVACVHSVLQCTYADFDIIVVDNGSTDDSVAQLRHAFPGLTILEIGENLGFAGGNNAGMCHALDHLAAEYIWLLNNDTVVAPDTLALVLSAIQAHPRLAVAGTRIVNFDDDEILQEWGGKRMGLWTGIPWPASPGRPPNFISGASMLLKREALQQCGLFDPAYFFYMEDVDLCFRLTGHGWKLAVADDALVRHKGSASAGARSSFQAYWYRRGLIRLVRTHAPFPWLPILGTTFLRLLLAFLARNGPVLRGTWDGFRDGLAEPLPMHPKPPPRPRA